MQVSTNDLNYRGLQIHYLDYLNNFELPTLQEHFLDYSRITWITSGLPGLTELLQINWIYNLIILDCF